MLFEILTPVKTVQYMRAIRDEYIVYNNIMKKLGKYFPKDIEPKWKERWQKEELYAFKRDEEKEPYYNLVELPYPSGDLHLGHWFAFVPPDVHARYNRMKGKNVFFPNGFDAFGLPAENAAIKRGIHPRDWTLSNIDTMHKQFETMGTMIAWDHEVITCDPEYYAWNQWIFIQLYKKGLAYRGKTLSNWCPSCQTVLANEAIENGTCWRCGSVVEQKEIEQWYLRITDYADDLLWENTDQKISNNVNWPKSVREGQNNWIGRSEGCEISFDLDRKHTIVILHGFGGTPDGNFYEWLKQSLENKGHTVYLPSLPNTNNPTEEEQVSYVLENFSFDNNTILYGHSLGSVVALKVLEKLKKPIAGLVLSGTFAKPVFLDEKRQFEQTFDFAFDAENIRTKAGFIRVIQDIHDPAVPLEQAKAVADMLNVPLEIVEANGAHFSDREEPELLKRIIPSAEVFTTRPDTLYGATFLVLAPEHRIVRAILDGIIEVESEHKTELLSYAKLASQKTEMERKEQKEKTGVFSGVFAIHPQTGEKIPVWVADYVLSGYGTGAIMAVPAHDGRDYEFATQFDLPIKQVIQNDESDTLPYTGPGNLINSGNWDGWQVPDDIAKVIESLEKARVGRKKVTYHLHDWSISRQRYWGTPVPMIHCDECGIVPVSEEDLPLELPYEVDYTPKGKPPLATAEEWLTVSCPKCGKEARRDAETLDTFFDSSWYYYRYVNPSYKNGPFDPKQVKDIMPVDIYFGGAEHTLGHTLYARFFTKFFKSLDLVSFDEFAKKRVQHGVILGPDGNRMSKSKGNVVNPDDVVAEYGTDTVRVYLCFMMPYEDTVAPWNPKAIAGMYRFLTRVWQLSDRVTELEDSLSKEDLYLMHKTIQKVGDDLAVIKFNTALASLMEWLNHLTAKKSVSSSEYETFLLLLAPFAPYMTEEIWQSFRGDRGSIHLEKWPEFNTSHLSLDKVTIAVQVNGKLRDTLDVDSAVAKEQDKVEEIAKQSEKVMKHLSGKSVKKVIYVASKILNFVVV